MRRSLVGVTFCLFLLLALLAPAQAQSGVADWTYLVFYNGDNNLERNIFGDLAEMQAATGTDRVNIVAQVDRAPEYETGFGDWTDTRRFLLQHEEQPILTHEQKLDALLALASVITDNSGQDYHDLIPEAAALRESDPERYRELLTNAGVNPDDEAQVDQLVSNFEIGLEFNTEPVQDMGELNMGDPQTLVDFATWAIENFPASHYALTISTHGGGWLGNGPDETDHNDMLQLPELVQALDEITAQTGIDGFDLIGFDACLMGQLEVYRALEPYTRYVLASEEVIPSNGWEYTTPFEQLAQNPAMDAEEFGTNIVNAYMAYYAGPGARTRVDLGLIDESQIAAVADALDAFSAIADQDTLDKLSALGVARVNAQRFGTNSGSSLTGDTDYFSSIDLISFMELIAAQTDIDPDLAAAALDVADAAQSAIVTSSADQYLPDAHGMAIYLPTNSATAAQPTAADPATVPYADANPFMSGWNTFLDALHTTIDTALTPDKLSINITQILPSDGVASIYDPPVVIFDTDGQGIANLQFVAVLSQPDGTNLLVDSAPLSFTTVLPDGRPVNEFPSGVSEGNNFAWNVETLVVSDGTTEIPAVLFVNDPGLPQGVINGTYVSQKSREERPAVMVFDTDAQKALAVYGPDENNQVSEIRTQPGDQFIPYQYFYTADGLTEQPGTTALAFGVLPFTYAYVPAPSGSYQLGMVLQDLAGNSTMSVETTQVDNTGLDTAWRGFKDVEWGINFLYPWGWSDPSQLADDSGQVDQLQISDPDGAMSIYVGNRADAIDTVVQDMMDYEGGFQDAQVDDPAPLGDDPALAQWFSYSYTADDGSARTGVVIVVRSDENDATYTFDVDAPAEGGDAAQTILETLVNSLTFFPPLS
ncbi:MAG: clostripain-related cysteine peptidase [Anaerolineae bacterium]